MKIEKTVVIIKPDAVNRYLIGDIIGRFEKKGLKIIAMKMEHLDDKKLIEHYAHLKDKPFFSGLIQFMRKAPSVLMILEGLDAVNVVRKLAGVTHGAMAEAGTIRGDYSISNQCNVIHASDSNNAAKIEIKRFFDDKEIFDYLKIDSDILYAEDER